MTPPRVSEVTIHWFRQPPTERAAPDIPPGLLARLNALGPSGNDTFSSFRQPVLSAHEDFEYPEYTDKAQ